MMTTKYWATFSVLTVLMLSAMLAPIPVGLAQNNEGEENQRIITESLLETLEAARNYVNATFTRLEAKGIPIPDAAKDEYGKGLEIAALAVQLRDAGDLQQANENAIRAMQKFKGAALETADEMEGTETPDEKEAYKAINQTAARNRAEISINKLEDLVDKAEELVYNVTSIRETLTEARSYIANATNLAEAGNMDMAEKEVGMAISTAAKTMGKLQPIVKANKATQAQKFLVKATERSIEEFGGAKPDMAENLAVIEKIEATITLLEERLEGVEGEGVDGSRIRATLETAKNLLIQALEHLQNEKIENASQAIDQADELTDEAEELLELAEGLIDYAEELLEQARQQAEEKKPGGAGEQGEEEREAGEEAREQGEEQSQGRGSPGGAGQTLTPLYGKQIG